MKVVSFTPIKGESQRLPKKNTREFSGIAGGLSALKLRQLGLSTQVDEYVISTDDPWVLMFGDIYLPKVKILRRPEKYCDRDLSTPGMHQMAIDALKSLNYKDEDIIVWAQVTSPLFDAEQYDECIQKYKTLTEHDCIQTVTPMVGFFIDRETGEALNWDREKDGNWPRTQTMKETVALDNACSVISFGDLKRLGDRMGVNPYYYTSPSVTGWDIDTLDDFRIAEYLYNTRQVRKHEDIRLREGT